MRLVVCVLAAVSFAAPCRAQVTQPPSAAPPPLRLSERDAVARLSAADARIRALAARVEEVRAGQGERALWPNPSATYSHESVGGTHDTFLLARQELPITGRRGHLQEAGRLAVEAAEADARFATIELQADVREAYTSLLVAQDREGTLQEALDALRKLIAMLRAREEAGEGSSYDRMRGERALVELESELALASGDRAQAQGQLAAYFGPGTIPAAIIAADRLDSPPAPADLSTLVAQALASRGDYQSLQLSMARFDAERQAAARLKVPTPTLTGGLKRSDLGGSASEGYQFSIDMSVPLFNRGQAATSLATAQRQRVEAESEAWRTRIAADVTTAYRVATIRQERAARYRESAAAIAEPLVKVGRVGYEEGELSILELLDAERQALEARLRVLDLAAAARRAAIELDRVVGQELKP